MFQWFSRKKESAPPPFIENIEDYPHLRIIHLKGYLNNSSIPDLAAFLRQAKEKKGMLNKSVLLDLKNVGQVDSAAIAELLKVCSSLKQKNFKLGLMNVPDGLKGMIQILKLENILLVFESERRAFSEILAWSQEWS